MKVKEKKEKYIEENIVTEVVSVERDGVSIDNYGTTEVYEKGELVDIVKADRDLPPEVRPPSVVPAPEPGAKLTLLDHKDPFWIFNKEEKRDKTYWVVRNDKGETRLIDAVTGKEVGHGTPPPVNRATAISGYCAGYNDPWKAYRANAASYYNRWGYGTWNVYAPGKSSVGAAVRNKDYKMWYCLAHGDSNRFQLSGRTYVYASDIRSYMAGGQGSGGGDGGPIHRPTPDVPAPGGRPPFQFSFLGQCGAFTSMSSSTIHSAFRRGATTKTCAIGYYNAHLSAGWRYSLSWQKKLFLTVNSGYSFYTAFKRANAAYPACRDMTRFVGDTTVGKNLIDYGDEYEDDNGGSGDDQGGNSGGSSGAGPRGRGSGGSGGSGSGRGRGGSGRGSGGAGPRGR